VREAIQRVGAREGDALSVRAVVVGAEPLGLAIVERLVAAGARVTVLAAAAELARYGHELERTGAPAVIGSATAPGELLAAGLAEADVLVLATDSDAENVDAALTARRLRPKVRLVVRVFDRRLADYLRGTLEHIEVMSMALASAPVFADLALRALAETAGGTAPAAPRRRRPPLSLRVDRVLVALTAAPLLLVIPFTAYFAHALNLRTIDALYFVWTTMLTVGYGDISLREASDAAKLVGMGLMFVGAALIAVLYAILTGWVVARRQDVRRGRVPVRGRGHVVIIGAGNVGLTVARLLGARGHRIVLVERDEDNRRISELRAEGHQVIVADAALDETLDLAAVDRAAGVVALTDSDATNLHVALAVRRRRADVRVVVRLLSRELSAHVMERGDAFAASSVDIGGAAFATAALQPRGGLDMAPTPPVVRAAPAKP